MLTLGLTRWHSARRNWVNARPSPGRTMPHMSTVYCSLRA